MNLKENQDNSFELPPVDREIFEVMSKKITDAKYLTFINKVSNGGFFFDKSLHLYGMCNTPPYHNISFVNSIINHEYGELANGLIFFGQDALGNQFAFSNKGIVSFNIETGDIEVLASDFDRWIQIVFSDLDYFTGRNLLKVWSINNEFRRDQRLCAKKPFVVGGEYNIQNLYSQFFPTYISSNANIAKQIYGLPDGTKITIKTIE